MVKKKVDPRVRGLIENGVRKGHRSMFILVGDHGKDQVENLHKILSKTRVKARPSVLWCYKKDLGFSTHKKKRMKQIKKNQQRGLHDPDIDDPFDLFISSTNIRWAYYKETDKILGQTFGMCVLQDFEALTPNLLARTIETVEGGGIVIILLKTVKSLQQLYTMTMDVHSRYRTEAHYEIVPRFNERFILSLGDCQGCLVLDDELNILPISSHVQNVPISEGFGVSKFGLEEGDADLSGYVADDPELRELKESLADTPNIGSLVNLTKTIDQANAVMSFLDAISEQSLKSTVSLTAGRGRGKSAAIGLCLAGAVSYGYSNIFVTAPSPENLKTVFEFIIAGLKELKYTEHLDFESVLEQQGDVGKVITRINIFKGHRQTIQYILPTDSAKLAQAELLAIDEAAAIPLPNVKKLLGPYLVFLSSTVNGYEGTGRALSLKLIQQLRARQGASQAASAINAGKNVVGAKSLKSERKVHEERWKVAAEAAANFTAAGSQSSSRTLTELVLDKPIRYKSGDPIEKWLNNLLCLDIIANSTRITSSMPAPKDCELYYVDRDALFSYHSLSETLLQRIWALYTSAHYKNSPNDLQMLSDAPAHRLFILLGPNPSKGTSAAPGSIPDILCVVQVALEGKISRQSVQSELLKGNKASGDLIPWAVSQQFNDSDFASLSGARIVRIATHPDVQNMGYGSRAVDLIIQYFQGNLTIGKNINNSNTFQKNETESNSLQDEIIKPRTKLPPLLVNIHDFPIEQLHWVGVSFGLTNQLLNFWSRKGFKVCYVRQTTNELTGEYSTIMLKELDCNSLEDGPQGNWLHDFVKDYQKRMVSLLSFGFSALDIGVAITLLDPDKTLSSVTSKDSELEEVVDDEQNNDAKINLNHQSNKLTAEELLSVHISHYDFQRLELYSRNMVDHHMILDLIPILSRLIFTGRISSLRLSHLQLAVLLAIGLQHRDVDSICTELDLPANQVLAFFNKTIRRITSILRNILESQIKKEFPSRLSLLDMRNRVSEFNPTSERLSSDQVRDERAFNEKLAAQKNFVISLPKQENSNLIEEAADKPIKKKKKNKNSWKPKRDRDSNGNDQNLSKKERNI